SHGARCASLGYNGAVCDFEGTRRLFAADGKRFRGLIDHRNLPMKWKWTRGPFGGCRCLGRSGGGSRGRGCRLRAKGHAKRKTCGADTASEIEVGLHSSFLFVV